MNNNQDYCDDAQNIINTSNFNNDSNVKLRRQRL